MNFGWEGGNAKENHFALFFMEVKKKTFDSLDELIVT